jgi:hypothetical protein
VATVTNKRVLFLDKGMLYGLKQLELPLQHISAVSHKTGLIFGKIEVATGGGIKKIDNIDKKDVVKVAQIISDLINKPKDSTVTNTEGTSNDVVSKLERLAALRQSGILSDQEFTEQKTKILAR